MSHPPSADIPTTSAPDPNNNNNHPLLRDESVGMNPVTLVTGFYGPRGERIRHVVHEGALRLPAPALLDPMIVATTDTTTTTNPVVLPDCDAVQRPSLQPTSSSPSSSPLLVVTEVHQKETVQEDISPVDGTIRTTTLSQTIIQNVNLTPPVPVVVIGGGGDQESSSVFPMDVDPVVAVHLPTKSAPTTTTTSTTSTAVPTTNVPTSASSTLPTPPADPNLQPQQISNMEQALLLSATTVPNSSSISSSSTAVVSNLPPTTTVTSSSVVVDDAPTVAKVVVVASQNPPPPGRVIPLTPRPTTSTLVSSTTTTTTTIHPGPTWYQSDRVAAVERAVLSEWFDGSATHRTEASYMEARERIVALATSMPDQYVTGTMVRRTVAGDAGSLLRLHAFLTSHQMINQNNTINESTPPPMILLTAKQSSNKRAKIRTNDDWDDTMKWNVLQAVVEQSRTKMIPADHDPDWSAVAKSVGHGVTAAECEHLFRTMSIPTVHNNKSYHHPIQNGSVTPDVVASVSTTGTDPTTTTTTTTTTTKSMMPHDWITDLVNDVDPALRRTVTMAALSHTTTGRQNDLSQVPKAAVLGLIVRDAMDTAQEQEERVVEILSEVMELRMQRIESRLSTLDDVEDMLEAERVALELERRDLYTARCRHWFGGT